MSTGDRPDGTPKDFNFRTSRRKNATNTPWQHFGAPSTEKKLFFELVVLLPANSTSYGDFSLRKETVCCLSDLSKMASMFVEKSVPKIHAWRDILIFILISLILQGWQFAQFGTSCTQKFKIQDFAHFCVHSKQLFTVTLDSGQQKSKVWTCYSRVGLININLYRTIKRGITWILIKGELSTSAFSVCNRQRSRVLVYEPRTCLWIL